MHLRRVNAAIVTACVLAAGMVSAPSSSAGVDLQSAVAVWLFDDGNGDTAKDLTGNGNDGKLINAPKWVDGKFGGALEFNGADSYVAVDVPVGLPTLFAQRTIMCWFKSADAEFASSRELVGWGSEGGPNRCGMMISKDQGVGFETGNFRFEFRAPWEIDTEWHHLAIALPPGERTKADKWNIYLDAELRAGQAAGVLVQIVLSTGAPLTIGVEPDQKGHEFEGILDEVAIFPTELTAAEIKSIMQSGLVGAQDVSPAGKLATMWARIKNS